MINNLISNLLNFINDNPSLVTLFVGLLVFVIYTKQKKDRKRNAAKLILQEIRYAENNIKVAKEYEDKFKLSIKLLPTSTWYKNIHMFVEDLSETEIDTVSKFYSKVEYIDNIINVISTYKLGIEIPPLPPQMNTSQASNPQQSTNTPQPIQPSTYVYRGLAVAEGILKNVTSKIEYIYNTPVADKLRSISEKRWYKIL